ncbi:MAG: AAA family ATPase [Ectothiorhodospiraceae bacterium AqS1]|nr:AAA family ATPase [Ectothiorhodospiraceae bacterium AqS1]
MEKLNVLIGPNGSGKSNFIDAIGLLQATPHEYAAPIPAGDSVGNWVWRGEPMVKSAQIEVEVDNPKGYRAMRYRVVFAERGQTLDLIDERVENAESFPGYSTPYIYFEMRGDKAILNYRDGKKRQLRPEDIWPQWSILSQRKNPRHYPELAYLGESFSRIRLYREWSLGRNAPSRLPQKADLPNDFLREDGKNLGLILNRFMREPEVKKRVLDALQKLYEGVSDFDIVIEGGTVQLLFHEGHITVPATRLSDGTLCYLYLLAILCHPKPPPLVCIENPEFGLHPDILPTLGDLLIEASKRCQLIVTTHSDVLLDALTETPESVVVCEKRDGRTDMRRLNKEDLSDRLERYTLGELWCKGEIGGNRW